MNRGNLVFGWGQDRVGRGRDAERRSDRGERARVDKGGGYKKRSKGVYGGGIKYG